MKQTIVIETENDVNLDEYLKNKNTSVQRINELTKSAWSLMIEMLMQFSEEKIENNDKYKVVSVDTFSNVLQ